MSTAASTCSERTEKEITMNDLFNSFELKGLALSNRVVMSAMTRTRATEEGVPTDVMRDYYVQRASAGLIVTECTQVSDQAHGIMRAPGLHRADQIAAWREITGAVHAAGGRIYCQIWHCPSGHARRRAAGRAFAYPRNRRLLPTERAR
jgi:2,4-dienoyl-CoA reductase-like NADH-dependent reductase (Old Yellow Enzyme family)